MKPEPKKSSEERLPDIAAAACDLIAERGFEGLRTRDIAARVGINIATLHYHVPTKEALIELVAQSIRAEFIAQHHARPRVGLSPLDLLKVEFDDFREKIVENPKLYTVMAELTERSRRDPNVAAQFRPMQRFWHQQLAAILADGIAQGQFRPDLDPQVGALMVIGTLIATQRNPETTLELFDRACAELVRALSVPSPANLSQDTDKD